MLWSLIHHIIKTSSVTPEIFCIFNLILSFSTCSQSFKKICFGNFWARTSLNSTFLYNAPVPKIPQIRRGKGFLRSSTMFIAWSNDAQIWCLCLNLVWRASVSESWIHALVPIALCIMVHAVLITLTLISGKWRWTGTSVVISAIGTISSVQTGTTGTFIKLCNTSDFPVISKWWGIIWPWMSIVLILKPLFQIEHRKFGEQFPMSVD